MTEEVEKVTTEKPKNPGRQEWGRKLGKMQKLKKQNEEVSENKSNSFFNWGYTLAGVTVLVGLAALYYKKKSYECQLELQPQQKPMTEKKEARFSDF
jgi:LPXTG-motif cell wall-anchored protein